MITVKLKEKDIIKAANEGMDAFVGVFVDGINDAIGGELTGDTMPLLNADQITLLAYVQMRDEVMDGGFVQLIHNGYGPFLFKNPFAKALKMWGLTDLSKLVYSAAALYNKHHEAIEADCSDDEFMSLFERFPDFDDLDDEFVENEEKWTARIAEYIDEHIEAFAIVEK